MEDILTDIVKHKREELKSLKSLLPINVLRSRLDCILPEIRSMSTALADSSTVLFRNLKRSLHLRAGLIN
jgi:hypothetical protein